MESVDTDDGADQGKYQACRRIAFACAPSAVEPKPAEVKAAQKVAVAADDLQVQKMFPGWLGAAFEDISAAVERDKLRSKAWDQALVRQKTREIENDRHSHTRHSGRETASEALHSASNALQSLFHFGHVLHERTSGASRDSSPNKAACERRSVKSPCAIVSGLLHRQTLGGAKRGSAQQRSKPKAASPPPSGVPEHSPRMLPGFASLQKKQEDCSSQPLNSTEADGNRPLVQVMKRGSAGGVRETRNAQGQDDPSSSEVGGSSHEVGGAVNKRGQRRSKLRRGRDECDLNPCG